MRAAQINEYGDASIVHIVEIEKPVAGKGQIVVAVHAASLNPFDSKLRDGLMKDSLPLQFPVTLGGDIAGVVTEVGEGVTDFAVGEAVFGQANVVAGSSGAFAEFAATAAKQVAKAPTAITFAEAASLPLVGASAVQALIQHIQLQPGQKIFIHGGAGGIGSVAIQIAKHIGASVATTATGEGLAYVKQLGADEVIDYKAVDFATQLHDFDAVFDAVGGDDFAKALLVLKRGGIAVSMTAQADKTKTAELGVTAITQQTHVATAVLDQLRELVETGAVMPQVDKTFTLDQIQEAFRTRESGIVKGKIVIEITKS